MAETCLSRAWRWGCGLVLVLGDWTVGGQLWRTAAAFQAIVVVLAVYVAMRWAALVAAVLVARPEVGVRDLLGRLIVGSLVMALGMAVGWFWAMIAGGFCLDDAVRPVVTVLGMVPLVAMVSVTVGGFEAGRGGCASE